MPASVWGNRDFRLVLGGGFVNNVGDWLIAVALPSFVFLETGSGKATAAIVVIELLVSIAWGPYAGSLVDRWDLRRTVMATNVLQTICLAPLLAVTADRVWPAFVVAALQGGLRAVNDPASFSMLPRIVAPEQLNAANSANAAAGSLARLIGSPLGGIAAAAGGLKLIVVINGATFIAVALATWFVRTPTPSMNDGNGDEERDVSVRSGWQQIRRHPRLVGYLAAQTLANWTFAMFPVLFIAFVVEVLRGDEATVGIIRGMAAFGGLGASYVVGKRAKNIDPTWLMMWGYTGLGMIAFVFVNISSLTTALWVFLVLFALSGLPNITSQIGVAGTAQRLCPPELLGRFQGVEAATGSAGAIGGSLLVGLLIDVVDVKVLLNVQAGLYVSCGLLTLLLVIRHPPHSSL